MSQAPARAPSLARTRSLARARFAMLRRSGWPIPALAFLAALSGVLASLARGILPAFPHAWLALSLGPLALGLPILSDLSRLLRHDEALEWVGSLPARASERTLARTLQLLAWLAALALAWFVPWALCAPGPMGWSARLALPLAGLALALAFAAVLLWVQQLLLGRLPWALVALETVWMVLSVVGVLQLVGHLPEIAQLTPLAPGLQALPSTWLARAVVEGGGWTWSAPLLGCASLLALAALPASEPRGTSSRGAFERWLAPLRWLALRHWVRREERGTFELVFIAPAREREFALRTYPMVGIPLAFLWLAASDGSERWRSDVLALLLFTSGISLPLLLVHLPLSESHAAAWLQELSPCRARARQEGAIKAVFVRWVVPLYLALLVLGLALGRASECLRLWLPALALALLLVRWLYPRCVQDLPLSVAPEELRSRLDWAGGATAMALASTIVAVLANRFLDWRISLLVTLGLVTLEWIAERDGERRSPPVRGTSPSG